MKKLTEIPEKVDFFDALPDYDVAFFTNKKSKTDAEVSSPDGSRPPSRPWRASQTGHRTLFTTPSSPWPSPWA